jgi:peptidoglycan/xylan/chitin deacetylase (PgdA/CDA1 family)
MIARTIQIFFVSFFIFCFSFCFKTFAQINQSDSSDWGKLYVTTWSDNRQSAFSFSFDDGFISQYDHAKNILNQNDFPATYFILPPFLTDTLPGIWRYGTWQMFLEMYFEDDELASHSLNHPDLTQLPVGDTLSPNTIHYELYHSKKMINEKTLSTNCITFAYPFGEHNNLVDSLTSLYYESSREVGDIINQSSIAGKEWFKLKSYQVEFDMPRDSLENDLDELNEFITWIDNSIQNGTWGILLAHEVVPFIEIDSLLAQGAYHPIANEWLILLCDWLKDKSDEYKIWIETIGSITKYIKERESHNYHIISKSNFKIEIELSDTLNDELYNYPLTAFIAVPDQWDFVLVEQNNEIQVLESFYADSMQLVLTNVIPDGGIIKLTEHDPNYVAESTNTPDGFVLYQNYPNPFNPTTKIKFTIADVGTSFMKFVQLKVYDVLGNEVATLVNENLAPGKYEIEFNTQFNSSFRLVRNLPVGRQDLPSGIYFYKLHAGNYIETKKMVLLR